MAEQRKPVGWHWPDNSRKAHYYDADGRALCGKWALIGCGLPPTQHQDLGEKPGPDDCVTCWRKAKRNGHA